MGKICTSCGQSLLDFQRVCEKCGAIQPETNQLTQKSPRASAPLQAPPEQAAPAEMRRASPPPSAYAGPPTGRKVKPLILASILVVVVVGVVVAALLLKFNPFVSMNNPSTNGASCTMATNAGVCPIGNNLYLVDLHVSNSSYSNHDTYLIAFVINNTGTVPVNMTAINLDNQPVINGLPSPGSTTTSPFWVTYLSGHVIDSKKELQFALDVPRTTSSGAHKMTLVDSAGNQYAFSFNI